MDVSAPTSPIPGTVRIPVRVNATLVVDPDNTVHIVLTDQVDADAVVEADSPWPRRLGLLDGALALSSVTVELTPDTYEVDCLYAPALPRTDPPPTLVDLLREDEAGPPTTTAQTGLSHRQEIVRATLDRTEDLSIRAQAIATVDALVTSGHLPLFASPTTGDPVIDASPLGTVRVQRSWLADITAKARTIQDAKAGKSVTPDGIGGILAELIDAILCDEPTDTEVPA